MGSLRRPHEIIGNVMANHIVHPPPIISLTQAWKIDETMSIQE